MQVPFQPLIFMNQMPGFVGVNPVGIGPSFPAQNVMNGWQGIYNSNNMNNMNNMNQMNNMQQYDVDKINVVFKLTNGSIKIVTISLDKTVGELICIFLKKMGSEELIGNTKDICFLNNATKIKYDDQRKVRDVFNAINPTIIVNDVHNLIGAN